MKVSIITATYNSASTIGDTLKSVEDQTHSDIEHIIIDGQSKDDTLQILRKFQHLAKVISEPDKGIYDAMNKGISISTGDIIGILNSDDFYTSSDVISSVIELFDGDECLQCVYADLAYVSQNDTSKIVRKWVSGPYDRLSFVNGWMPPHPTFFVRKEVYDTHGLFNLDLKTAADYELMLRFLYKHHCTCQYLPKTIIKMRAGGASNSNFYARLSANKQDRLAWEVNGLTPQWFTLYLKPLRKLTQYF